MKKETPFIFVLILILITIITLSFTGCGSSSSDDPPASLNADDDDDDDYMGDDDDDDSSDDDDTDDDDDTSDDDDDTDDDDDDSTPTAQWTFVVYMAADNDLETFAFDDLSEMASVGGSTEDVNIIVIFDGTANNDSAIYMVGDEELIELQTSGELNMGSAQALQTTASYAFTNFPADKYALVFWNHGSGWHDDKNNGTVKWVCEDAGSGGDVLGNNELDSALANIRANSPATTIDLIGFDACLMQMIEIAYYIKNHGEVMVGSQETEDGDGWEYQNFLNQLLATPTMNAETLGTKIVQTYIAKPDATLSVLDLAAIGSLVTALDDLADSLVTAGGNTNASIMNAMYATLYFDDWDYIDLYHFADNLVDEDINVTINSRANTVKSRVSNAVLYSGYGFPSYSDSHGISIYFPEVGFYNTDYDYLDFAADTSWDDVIN